MQPPYTIERFAALAGTGDHTPPPAEIPRCVGCGAAIDAGRVYCDRPACRRRWSTIGTRAARRGESLPTLDTYSR